MNLTPLRGDIAFWDRFAPWYERWLSRGMYHAPIVRDLSGMIEPGWRVLEIGAATGALAIPLSSMGCTVRALEPAAGMREIFGAKLSSLGIGTVDIIAERWEDFQETEGPDLIVACNSLHLVEGGIMGGMKKVFSSGAAYIALITEINQDFFIDFKNVDSIQESHNFLSIRNYRLDSSFVFESMDEAEELEEILGRATAITSSEGRLVWKDATDIAVVWWERK